MLSIFDMLHFMLTVALGLCFAGIGFQFGFLWGVLTFIIIGTASFFVMGYGTVKFVLFLYKRYSLKSRIGYEVGLYLLNHIKEGYLEDEKRRIRRELELTQEMN